LYLGAHNADWLLVVPEQLGGWPTTQAMTLQQLQMLHAISVYVSRAQSLFHLALSNLKHPDIVAWQAI
jgi:hypothetical protein